MRSSGAASAAVGVFHTAPRGPDSAPAMGEEDDESMEVECSSCIPGGVPPSAACTDEELRCGCCEKVIECTECVICSEKHVPPGGCEDHSMEKLFLKSLNATPMRNVGKETKGRCAFCEKKVCIDCSFSLPVRATTCEKCRTTHPPDPMCACICMLCSEQDPWKCPHTFLPYDQLCHPCGLHPPDLGEGTYMSLVCQGQPPQWWCGECEERMFSCTRCHQKAPTACQACGHISPDYLGQYCNCLHDIRGSSAYREFGVEHLPPLRWCLRCMLEIGPFSWACEGWNPHEQRHQDDGKWDLFPERGPFCFCSSCGTTVHKRDADPEQWKHHWYHGRRKLECELCRRQQPMQQCFLCKRTYQIRPSATAMRDGTSHELVCTGHHSARAECWWGEWKTVSLTHQEGVLRRIAAKPWETLKQESRINPPAEPSNVWCGQCAVCSHCRQCVSFPSGISPEPTTQVSSMRFMSVNHPLRQECYYAHKTQEAAQQKHHALVELPWQKYPFDRVCVQCYEKCAVCQQSGVVADFSGDRCLQCLQCQSCERVQASHESFRTGSTICRECDVIQCCVCERALSQQDVEAHAAEKMCTQCRERGHTTRDHKLYRCEVCAQEFGRLRFQATDRNSLQQKRRTWIWCTSCLETSIRCCCCERQRPATEFAEASTRFLVLYFLLLS